MLFPHSPEQLPQRGIFHYDFDTKSQIDTQLAFGTEIESESSLCVPRVLLSPLYHAVFLSVLEHRLLKERDPIFPLSPTALNTMPYTEHALYMYLSKE